MGYIRASSLGVLSRIIAAVCRLWTLPLVLGLLDADRYGLWLILSSVLAWLSLTDFGIPSALQNPLVEYLSVNNRAGACCLLKHAHRMLIKIALLVAVVGVFLAYKLPIGDWLNIDVKYLWEFRSALMVSIVLICASLPLKTASIISYATNRPELPPIADIIVQLVSLGLIAVFAFVHFKSLFALVIAICAVQFVVTGVFQIYIIRKTGLVHNIGFTTEPSAYDSKNLRSKGIVFLLVLIGEGLILQSDAFLIGYFKGAELVTHYIIPHTLFLQFFMLQNAFLRPLWAKLTHYKAVGDDLALRYILRKSLMLGLATGLLFGLSFVFLSAWFVRYWTHGVVNIPQVMAWGFGFYAVTAAFGNILALFSNATGLVNKRLYAILVFGLLKTTAGATCLSIAGIELLPLIYGLVCLFTDVLMLTWFTRNYIFKI
jgi:O-antigen/teichoic acid export membrane protein